ncbi:MAG TPA: hypothetical protein PLP19_16850 [bacterium]|nr:hypothetical protein [bacterium]HPN45163.1 hypothetical protein [bacterium]
MNVKIKIIIIIGLLPIIFNCWKKQGNEITRPAVPHYQLSGTTLDYDSGEILPHITIQVKAVTMLYSDVTFTDVITESDSVGKFIFDPIYPGNYVLAINTENAWHSSKNIEIAHSDRSIDLLIPQVQFATYLPKSYQASNDMDITKVKKNAAFCIDQSTCYINCAHDHYPLPPTEISIFKKEYIRWVYEKPLNPGIDYDSFFKMTCDYNNLLILAKNDTIIPVNKWTGYAGRKIKLAGLASLQDLVFNQTDNFLYACTPTEILKLSATDYSILGSYQFPTRNYDAIACNNTIFTFDKADYLLRQHNANMQIIKTFVIINSVDMSQITKLYDFDFDGLKNLWVMPLIE